MKNSALAFLFAFVLFLPHHANAARLWSSGCEMQSDSAPVAVTHLMEFDVRNGAAVKVDTGTTRTGVSSCHTDKTAAANTDHVTHVFANAAVSTAVYARMYVKVVSYPTGAPTYLINFWDQGIDGTEGSVMLNYNGTLTYIDDDQTPLATSSTAVALNTWTRVEMLYNDVSGGEVQIDGVSQFTIGAHDGDTVDSVDFGCDLPAVGCTSELYFDDMAVNDTTGTTQTSWPGAGSIVELQPDADGDGNGCSAGDVTSVDEITPDDASTICVLDADAGGDVLDVNVESSSNAGIDPSSTVTLVQVGIRESAASAASETWNLRIKSASGGTVTSGANISHADTTYETNIMTTSVQGNYSLTSYTDPTTAVAWTPTGTNSIDNMQIGANAVDGAPDIRVSTLWAIVEYLPAVPPNPRSEVLINTNTIINSNVIIN